MISCEIREARGIFGVTWGSENRPRSSFWAGWAAGTAGGAGRGGAGVLWRCVRCAEGWGRFFALWAAVQKRVFLYGVPGPVLLSKKIAPVQSISSPND